MNKWNDTNNYTAPSATVTEETYKDSQENINVRAEKNSEGHRNIKVLKKTGKVPGKGKKDGLSGFQIVCIGFLFVLLAIVHPFRRKK